MARRAREACCGLWLRYYGPRRPAVLRQDVPASSPCWPWWFAIGMLQRTNELVALMAAGISPARVILPLLVAAGVVSPRWAWPIASSACRGCADSLATNAQDLLGEASRKCTPRYDIRSDILISGKSTRAKDRRDCAAAVSPAARAGACGAGKSPPPTAFQQPATVEHPAGYLLQGVKQPANLAELASLEQDGQIVLYSPLDTPLAEAGRVLRRQRRHLRAAHGRRRVAAVPLVVRADHRPPRPDDRAGSGCARDAALPAHPAAARSVAGAPGYSLGFDAATAVTFSWRLGSCVVLVAGGVPGGADVPRAWGRTTCSIRGWRRGCRWLIFGPIAYTLARPLWD